MNSASKGPLSLAISTNPLFNDAPATSATYWLCRTIEAPRHGEHEHIMHPNRLRIVPNLRRINICYWGYLINDAPLILVPGIWRGNHTGWLASATR